MRVFQLGLAAAVALFLLSEVAAPLAALPETVSAAMAGSAR